MKKRLYPWYANWDFYCSNHFLQRVRWQKTCSQESIFPEGKLYHQSYDTVWDAVHSLIFTDLGCVEKKVNKKKGYIETEWGDPSDQRGNFEVENHSSG